MDPRFVLAVSIGILAVYLIVAYLWSEGVFCRHDWNTQQLTSDRCMKCGRIRFKDPIAEFLKRLNTQRK